MDDLTFANPEMAWLALPALALVIWGAAQISKLDKRLAKLGSVPVVRTLVASYSPTAAGWRLAAVGLALLLLVGAATRPRYGLRETEVANAGIDIAICVDASKSMLVRDITPNRLQGTAMEISAMLGKLAGGRVALVPFAGIPFVQTPLTTDHEVVRTYMAELKPAEMPIGGTNIGRAITLATEVLTGSGQRVEAKVRGNLVPQFRGSEHKAIVLFSDGEDHEGAALEAAKKAAAKGIRIYTVGVGSGYGDPVPIVAADGTVTGTLKDAAGNPIFSKLNTELLKAVAKETGGKFYHYANKSIASALFSSLDALEKAEYTERFKLLGEDRYQYLLGPALLLLLASILIPVRRAVAVALLLLGLGLSPQVARAGPAAAKAPGPPAPMVPVQAVERPAPVAHRERTQADARRDPKWTERENPDIADGRELLGEGKPGQALAAFKQARASRPEHAVIWYNIALAQAALLMYQEAEKSFGRSLSALAEHDPQLEADLHYSAGTAQLRWGLSLLDKAKAETRVNAGTQPGSAPTPAPAKGGGKPAGKAPVAGPGKTARPASAAEAAHRAAAHFREAVEELQAALIAAPQRPEIRKNLEIARLYAYPPCRLRDRSKEPNDQPDQAQELELDPKKREQHFALRSCPADRDYFSLALHPGDRLSVSLEAKAEQSTDIDPLDRDPGRAPELGLALLSEDGKTWIRGAPPPAKPLSAVELSHVSAPETMLVAVRNVAEVEASYDLTVKLLPACRRIEDGAEPNDSPRQARALPIGKPVTLRLCPRNEDWFGVPLQPRQGLLIRAEATFDVGAQELSMEVLDPSGRVVTRAHKGEKGWAARLAAARVPGTYAIRVRGGIDTEADYKLQAAVTPPCGRRDDPWEENDRALTANPLEPDMLRKPLGGLQLCPGDDDWYAVELKEGESLFADLTARVQGLPDVPELAGALTLTVYDAKGQVWRRARGPRLPPGAKTLHRTAAVLSPPPGRYWIRVTGGGVEAPHFPLPPLPDGARREEVQVPLPAPGRPGRRPPMPRLPMGGTSPSSGIKPPGPAQPAVPGGITATPVPPGQPIHPGRAGGSAHAPPGAGGGAAPKTMKVVRVILPPGYPPPRVDPGRALLDLPYALALRIVPPCPGGNDELEDNDEAGKAKEIRVGQERLLRICRGDTDWLSLKQKAGQNLQVTARFDYANGRIGVTALDEGGSTELGRGRVAAPRLPERPEGGDSPAARRGRTAITGLSLKGPDKERTIKLRVVAQGGGENFYVLRVQEPPPPSKKKQKNPKKKDDKGKKNPDSKKKKRKNRPEDDKKERQRQRRHQQMRRHDRNPRNLEALEALRHSPFRNQRPAKDW